VTNMTKESTPKVGQLERKTQNRLVALFRDRLGYDYLGNWEDREDNSNVEELLLHSFLIRSGYGDTLIFKAVEELKKCTSRSNVSLYDLNRETYSLLRYGVKVKEGHGEHYKTVWLIDWEHPEKNDFAFVEEVTVKGNRTKRPDIVLYVNGIALGVIELKRSIVSVSEGIRQNIGNQKDAFIKPFFATVQLVMPATTPRVLSSGLPKPKKTTISHGARRSRDTRRRIVLIAMFCKCARRSGFSKSFTTSLLSTAALRRPADTTSTSGSKRHRNSSNSIRAG